MLSPIHAEKELSTLWFEDFLVPISTKPNAGEVNPEYLELKSCSLFLGKLSIKASTDLEAFLICINP